MTKEKKKVENKPGLLAVMGAKYNLDPVKFLETIKATVMRPGKNGRVASNEEIAAFLTVANKYNLDPFTNEIYAFPAKGGGIIPVVGVDGFVTLINRNRDFNGMEIEFSDEVVTMDGAKSCPEWCEVKMFRKNLDKSVVVREYLDEVYCPPKSGYSGPWQSHTKRMLRHKTIIQASRITFGITGIYDPDEADRILEAEVIEKTPGKPLVEMPKEVIEGEAKEVKEKPAEKSTEKFAEKPKEEKPKVEKEVQPELPHKEK